MTLTSESHNTGKMKDTGSRNHANPLYKVIYVCRGISDIFTKIAVLTCFYRKYPKFNPNNLSMLMDISREMSTDTKSLNINKLMFNVTIHFNNETF